MKVNLRNSKNDPSFRFFYPLNCFWKDRHDPKKGIQGEIGAQEVGSGDCHQGDPRFFLAEDFSKKMTGAGGSIHSLVGG